MPWPKVHKCSGPAHSRPWNGTRSGVTGSRENTQPWDAEVHHTLEQSLGGTAAAIGAYSSSGPETVHFQTTATLPQPNPTPPYRQRNHTSPDSPVEPFHNRVGWQRLGTVITYEKERGLVLEARGREVCSRGCQVSHDCFVMYCSPSLAKALEPLTLYHSVALGSGAAMSRVTVDWV